MALDHHAYAEAGLFLGACALIGSGIGLIVGLLRGPRMDLTDLKEKPHAGSLLRT